MSLERIIEQVKSNKISLKEALNKAYKLNESWYTNDIDSTSTLDRNYIGKNDEEWYLRFFKPGEEYSYLTYFLGRVNTWDLTPKDVEQVKNQIVRLKFPKALRTEKFGIIKQDNGSAEK